MTLALAWLGFKTWLKKVKAWCKKYWQLLVGAAIPIIFMILAGQRGNATKLLKRAREDHEKELEVIEKARLEEIERLENASKKYIITRADIEKKYSELSKQLDDDKKMRIAALLEEAEEDPEVLTKKISEIMGFKLYN